ncbi:hypothetical protein LTR62_003176 [Meristemomyces frigidus]|uniref:NACHT-NTPase and P-loop NTPases N-terminal domain-containing protein n=1 Tax=Meristemomyces frigidus TaxID=1508187 RepID=A0AAN7YRX0_9PEZI|nr:hypothetical protein LTR62_003176 [Meristemomyces frigidus]
MSGAEAITIIGLIASVTTIIETSRDLYDAATSAQGLHDAFRAVSQNIPLVLNILRDCKTVQEQIDRDYAASTDAHHRHELEESSKAVKPVMSACAENAQQLKKILEKVVPGDTAHWLERYKKATQAVMPYKKRKVEYSMKEMLEKLQVLHTIEAEKRSAEVEAAIQHLSELPPSLPEDDSRYSHSGAGPMNVNAGGGIQKNYSQSGGSNNKMYNAENRNFGGD